MKEIKDFDKVEEPTSVGKVKVGPQLVVIKEVEDLKEKEYLQIKFDIASGEQKGMFEERENAFGDWPNAGIHRQSYKEKALPFFKRFITAIENSNENFKWGWDEQKLVGKYFIANYGVEEFVLDDEVHETVKMREPRSVKAFKEGNVKPPSPKRLAEKDRPQPKAEDELPDIINEDDLPF